MASNLPEINNANDGAKALASVLRSLADGDKHQMKQVVLRG